MGFFDKMKLAVGVGGAKVELQLNPGAVAFGGFARGQVVLKGGKADQKCNLIEARLDRIETVRTQVEGRMVDREQVETLETQKLAEYGFDIGSGSEQSWNFAFKVPKGADSRTKFRIHATADIPGAIDPSAKVDVPTTDKAEATPDNATELLSTAQTLRQQSGDHGPQIESLLKQAVKLEADNTQALRMLAEQVGYRSDAEATAHWKKYLELVPNDVEGWEELARNAERRGAHAESLGIFDKALTLAPNKSYLHSQRARVLTDLNRFDEAVAAYDAARKGDSPDLSHSIARAQVLIKAGKTQLAEAALLEVGESGDKYQLNEVLELLTSIGAGQHEDRLFAKALKVNEDDQFYVHEVLAQRLFKKGQYEQALEACERAMKAPHMSEWNLSSMIVLKGQALEHLNRKEDAKVAYKKALEVNKDNSVAKTRLKAL